MWVGVLGLFSSVSQSKTVLGLPSSGGAAVPAQGPFTCLVEFKE